MSGQVASMVQRKYVKDIIEGLMRDLETEKENLFKYFGK